MKKTTTGNGRADVIGQLRELRKIIGAGAVRSLQMGKSTLRIWRRTSPHNWWVENKRGETLWHSSDGQPRPSLSLFELIKHSPKLILTGHPEIVGRDEGAPEESAYKLKPEYSGRPIRSRAGGLWFISREEIPYNLRRRIANWVRDGRKIFGPVEVRKIRTIGNDYSVSLVLYDCAEDEMGFHNFAYRDVRFSYMK